MPRPSKRVAPNTLGGRIRAARQNLHLSLADVARGRYSTSLISQIERNRVDPSHESLQYLAERLALPLEELMSLTQQQRESEAEAHRYKSYEDQRAAASQLLASNSPRRAVEQLQHLNVSQIPAYLRWRLLALRGECHFTLREFVPAQRDFLSAVAGLPEELPQDQLLEAITLRLHLAAATRELGQLDEAGVQYKQALSIMSSSTPLRYVAETHWGMALVLFELANKASNKNDTSSEQAQGEQPQIQVALQHAQDACTLYNSIGERLRAALLNCQIALIEQSVGHLDEASRRLHQVLDDWVPTLGEPESPRRSSSPFRTGQYTLKERANVVSAAACYLAGVEHQQGMCDEALEHIQLALEAGQKSYILRRAEAYMMKGQILADGDLSDPRAEEAFQAALRELESTDRLAAKIRAYNLLGRHLMKQGRAAEGEKELDKALRLSNILTRFSSATTSAEDVALNG